jgi:diketogulonate reductase-like aldo/keto reductase
VMMEDSHARLSSIPRFFYGTAWKEERTEALVEQALAAGFRGIDTANQRRHYNEAAAGDALRKSNLEVFIQTKYTYVEGQDQRLPYDPAVDYPTQVRQSFESSLTHLPRVDSYLLHGPRTRSGISRTDAEVWRTMEEIQKEGRVQFIGVSNVTADQLALLHDEAEVKPFFVQNRCFARLGWDREVRQVCARTGVVYQGFSLLTANFAEIARSEIRQIAAAHNATIPQVIFRFALQLGMIVLTGTITHMQEALSSADLSLSEAEMNMIERISG